MNLTNAQRIAAVEAIADKDGDIAVDALWQAAKSPKNPLHNLFPWDEEKAAVEHWRYLSRKIIASCRVEITYGEAVIVAPRFIRDPEQESGYKSIFTLATNEDVARRALLAEIDRIESAANRALAISRAFNVEAGLQGILVQVRALKAILSEDDDLAAKARPDTARHGRAGLGAAGGSSPGAT